MLVSAEANLNADSWLPFRNWLHDSDLVRVTGKLGSDSETRQEMTEQQASDDVLASRALH